MKIRLYGKEEMTMTLHGWIPATENKKIDDNTSFLNVGDMIPVQLQLSRVCTSGFSGLPQFSINYDEAVWRIGVVHNGINGWMIESYNTNHNWLRRVSNILFNYNVKKAHFSFLEKRKSIITDHYINNKGGMKCHIEIGKESERNLDKEPVYIYSSTGMKLINYKEDLPEFRRESVVEIVKDDISSKIFGVKVNWEKDCLVQRGRICYYNNLLTE